MGPRRPAGAPGRSLVVLLATAALLVAACGEPDSERAPTASDDPTADFVNGGDCPPVSAAGLPKDAGCVTSVEGPSDGERLVVYARVGPDLKPRSWHFRLEEGSSTIEQRLDAGSAFSYPRAIGAADVNGDGRDEWFVKTLDMGGHGTARQVLTLFVVSAGRLARMTHEGEPLELRVGGTSRLGEGVTCNDGRIVLLRAEARNPLNTLWDVSARSFDLVGDRAELVGRDASKLRVADYNDPELRRFYGLDCAGLLHVP